MFSLFTFKDENRTLKKFSYTTIIMLIFFFFLCSASEIKRSQETDLIKNNIKGKTNNQKNNKDKYLSTDSKISKEVDITDNNSHYNANKIHKIDIYKNDDSIIQQTSKFLELADVEKLYSNDKLSQLNITISLLNDTVFQSNTTIIQQNMSILEPLVSTFSIPPSNSENINNPFYQKQSQLINELKNNSINPLEVAYTKFSCSKLNCASPNICLSSNICICSPENANYLSSKMKNANFTNYCSYSRKKQSIAFILEFLVPPAGHIYVGKYILAVMKFIVAIVYYFLFKYFPFNKNEIFYFGISNLSILWLVDIFIFGMNKYKDKNGVPLISW